MANIEGKGLPTRKTVGAIGDIYTDTNTKKRYKCTGSYGITTHGNVDFDYEWASISDSKSNTNDAQKQMAAYQKIVKESIKAEEPKHEVKSEPNPVIQQKPARQNYGKHYQKPDKEKEND